MRISAVEPFTLLDYPDKLACIVFLAGCNLRCSYCHNPEFVIPEKIQEIEKSFIPVEAFFNFLHQRQGLLDAVVISGGEATLEPELGPFIRAIKSLGFKVKLDTNGSKPELLRDLIRQDLLDYIAMDIKTNLDGYAELTKAGVDKEKFAESIAIIIGSSVEHEFRTTLIEEMHTPDVLESMANSISGAQRYSVQRFRNDVTLDPGFQNKHPVHANRVADVMKTFETKVKEVRSCY